MPGYHGKKAVAKFANQVKYIEFKPYKFLRAAWSAKVNKIFAEDAENFLLFP